MRNYLLTTVGTLVGLVGVVSGCAQQKEDIKSAGQEMRFSCRGDNYECDIMLRLKPGLSNTINSYGKESFKNWVSSHIEEAVGSASLFHDRDMAAMQRRLWSEYLESSLNAFLASQGGISEEARKERIARRKRQLSPDKYEQ